MTDKEELYQKLWRIADYLLKQNNPCQFETKAGVTTCIVNREHPDAWAGPNGCCENSKGPCERLGPTGCTVDSLGCKLFACPHIAVSYQDLYRSLGILRNIAYNSELPVQLSFFRSADEAFERQRQYFGGQHARIS